MGINQVKTKRAAAITRRNTHPTNTSNLTVLESFIDPVTGWEWKAGDTIAYTKISRTTAASLVSRGFIEAETINLTASFTKTTGTAHIGTIPAHYTIKSVSVVLSEALAGTNPTIEVGTHDDPDAYYSTTHATSIGAGTLSRKVYPIVASGESTLTPHIKISGTGLSTGAGTVTVAIQRTATIAAPVTLSATFATSDLNAGSKAIGTVPEGATVVGSVVTLTEAATAQADGYPVTLTTGYASDHDAFQTVTGTDAPIAIGANTQTVTTQYTATSGGKATLVYATITGGKSFTLGAGTAALTYVTY